MTKSKLASTVLSIIVALAVILAGCSSPGPEPSGSRFRNEDPSVQYTGQDSCRECHFEQFASYVKTGMGRAFYAMTSDEIVEDFTTANQVVIEDSGLHYRMVERDGKYYQRQFMVDSQGREVAVDEHEMLWVLGSNNHSRSYILEIDERMFQAPICWYPQEEIWELCPGYEFKNDHFYREISKSCVHCHNGVMKLAEGERNKFEKPYPQGIDCERCHGPGQLHVERWKQTGETPTGEMDDTIVNPRRLPAEERMEVCFQCHLGDARASERVIRWDRDVNTFRPGQPLTEIVVPFHYVQQTEHDFGLSAQTDRLILSKCYTASGGKLGCLNCHNPHVTVYHEDRPPDYFRSKCLGCHDQEACGTTHMARQETEPADDCVTCHMRKAEPDDQRFTEFTDHWIRRDIDLGERDHRTDYEVEPVFADRFASMSEGEQLFYRARAFSLLARDAPPKDQPWMWEQSEKAFRQAIDAGFDRVDPWFFMGKAIEYQGGRREEAEQAYVRAVEHDPAHFDASYALAQAMLARNDHAAAIEVLEGMLERKPDDAMALAELGRALTNLGRVDEAMEVFARAIRKERWSATLRLNRGMLLGALGRFEEASREADIGVKLDPDNPKMWAFYAQSHKAAGNEEAADEGVRMVNRLRAVKKKDATVARKME